MVGQNCTQAVRLRLAHTCPRMESETRTRRSPWLAFAGLLLFSVAPLWVLNSELDGVKADEALRAQVWQAFWLISVIGGVFGLVPVALTALRVRAPRWLNASFGWKIVWPVAGLVGLLEVWGSIWLKALVYGFLAGGCLAMAAGYAMLTLLRRLPSQTGGP